LRNLGARRTITQPRWIRRPEFGERFFSGKVDARIFLKLLPHFIDRSICVFELHEFVDPLGLPGKGSTDEMSSFEFVRMPDTGLFVLQTES
jgi:hypothetical protein